MDYGLIGATALAMQGIVRATEDVDLFLKATSENTERLRRAFRRVDGVPIRVASPRALYDLKNFRSIQEAQAHLENTRAE